MAGTTKWDDAAVKDLTMAILMSANNGNVNITANWDKVQVPSFLSPTTRCPAALEVMQEPNTLRSTETMSSWGYGFSKSAMSQHWSKKIVKQFKERHGDIKGSDNGDAAPMTPKKTVAPRKRAALKTPGTGRGKKRVAVDDRDDDSSPEIGYIADPIAKKKTPRSAAKKVKYEEAETDDSEARMETMGMNEGMVELEDEMEAAADKKAQKEDTNFSV